MSVGTQLYSVVSAIHQQECGVVSLNDEYTEIVGSRDDSPCRTAATLDISSQRGVRPYTPTVASVRYQNLSILISNEVRGPAELKHIIKRRKRK